jgi:hypothetical protein
VFATTLNAIAVLVGALLIHDDLGLKSWCMAPRAVVSVQVFIAVGEEVDPGLVAVLAIELSPDRNSLYPRTADSCVPEDADGPLDILDFHGKLEVPPATPSRMEDERLSVEQEGGGYRFAPLLRGTTCVAPVGESICILVEVHAY